MQMRHKDCACWQAESVFMSIFRENGLKLIFLLPDKNSRRCPRRAEDYLERGTKSFHV